MNPRSLNLLYFSPTGNGRRAARAIAEGIGLEPCREFDRTLPAGRQKGHHFMGRDLTVIVMPVYGGRLPRVIEGILAGITAHKSPAVFVVIYGNRDYEDALLELKHVATRRGFIGIAAAAVSSEHTHTRKVGTDRPDPLDLNQLESFGRNVMEKVRKLGLPEVGANFPIKGTFPYRRPPLTLQLSPTSTASCHSCLTCVTICPMGAVNSRSPEIVDQTKCISCCQCVKCCPYNARTFRHEVLDENIKYLESHCLERREAEIFM